MRTPAPTAVVAREGALLDDVEAVRGVPLAEHNLLGTEHLAHHGAGKLPQLTLRKVVQQGDLGGGGGPGRGIQRGCPAGAPGG